MPRLSSLALHAIAPIVMTWGWLNMMELIQSLSRKGGYFQFLTNQGLAMTWLCMIVGLFCDVFPSVTIARQIKRTLLMISMPVEIIVTSVYWPMVIFLPHLIILPTPIPRPTIQVDLALHASPLLFLLIDFFVFEPKFPTFHARKAAPAAIVAFSVWYASFVEYCATFNGSFPYPFLTYSPPAVRVLIYATIAAFSMGCFRTLNALHA